MTGANSDLNYLSYFKINFQNSCGYNVANYQGCWKKVRSSSVLCSRTQEDDNKQSGSNVLGHPVIDYIHWYEHFVEIHTSTNNIYDESSHNKKMAYKIQYTYIGFTSVVWESQVQKIMFKAVIYLNARTFTLFQCYPLSMLLQIIYIFPSPKSNNLFFS